MTSWSPTAAMIAASPHHTGQQMTGTGVVAVKEDTKSVMAGKTFSALAQAQPPGGLLQSGPCAQPHKLMRLKQKRKKEEGNKQGN